MTRAAPLTAEQAAHIKWLSQRAALRQDQIAAVFEIDQGRICEVLQGRRYPEVAPARPPVAGVIDADWWGRHYGPVKLWQKKEDDAMLCPKCHGRGWTSTREPTFKTHPGCHGGVLGDREQACPTNQTATENR